ncbi:MAG: isochorismatase family protein [Candidatus Sungbacteria bacterium]|nr:isochorismatase family protein [Candidatus Sungbacteria bacterium]
MRFSFLSIDLQNDFTTEGGKHYTPKASVSFLKETLFPFLEEKNIKVNEIISDYRQPRPGDRDESCVPGTWGYESIVSKELVKSLWLKCMNSPIWIRENIGDPNKGPSLPYQDPKKFDEWLRENLGEPGKVIPVVFGLTIDCCVLSTLQELSWRGYYPWVLKEAVDHYSGKPEDKEAVLKTVASNWAEIIVWEDLRPKLVKS